MVDLIEADKSNTETPKSLFKPAAHLLKDNLPEGEKVIFSPPGDSSQNVRVVVVNLMNPPPISPISCHIPVRQVF